MPVATGSSGEGPSGRIRIGGEQVNGSNVASERWGRNRPASQPAGEPAV